ncbi:hypothetical protein OIE66_27220 [Nonomuraea sp. NBC_01738]|uniref:hypothetical protein n=1 Tax=Nonomuraea sp. NBC_01738 TaxID=2976003 RepID=UPI002E12646A|nr:hypothetical protein OIE66_27220 [Nonomuraea sp. NBC_01738]
MTEILDAFNTPSPRGPGPGPAGKVILVLLWLTMSAAPLYFSLGDLDLALGRTGTPGTLTVDACTALGEGRYDCRATFRPDSGGDGIGVAASPDAEAGQVYPAALAPGGERAVRTGRDGVLAALILPATGLACSGFLPYAIGYWRGWRRRRIAVVFGVVVTAAGLTLVVMGFAAL